LKKPILKMLFIKPGKCIQSPFQSQRESAKPIAIEGEICYPSTNAMPETGVIVRHTWPVDKTLQRRRTLSDERSKTRHKRLETLNLVSLSHRDPEGRVDLETVGRTLDLSEGGILLECSQEVPSDNKEVEVILGIREHVIKVTGDIVHMRDLEEGNIGLGIAFRDLSTEDARIISDFMSEDEE
jgi:hypothetical protein